MGRHGLAGLSTSMMTIWPALTDRALCQGSTGEFLVLVAVVSGGVVIR
jgi:hypothetical protein